MKSQEDNSNIATLQQLGSHSHDAVMIVDRAEKVIAFANTASNNLLGVKTGDSMRKLEGLLESVTSPDQDYVRNKYVHIHEQLSTTNIEFTMIGSAGETVWLNCDTYLLQDKRFVYAIARDITKAKEHEAYLVEYGAKKNTLLDTLTHQLAGSLMLMNNLALRAGKLNVTKDQSALEDFVSLVENNSRHAIDIIDDLLKKEHTESPGIHVKFTRTDVNKVVNYIVEELRKSGGKRSILFETTSNVIQINTDEVKLLQIVNNFASNAVKFTRENGEIRISVREGKSAVVIAVADNGIGIPDTLQPFVFEKHGPARRTGLNGEKSIGLGLSICRHLVNLVGGKIWFESKEGVGTTFFVELPKE